MNILIFGDQTADQISFIQSVISKKDNACLSTFLERSAAALREEVQKLHFLDREKIPNFLTISHLVESYQQSGKKIPQIESSLVTISQLSHFIGYFSECPTEFPDASRTRCVGLCTGAIAAAAVSCSRSVSELIPLAVEAVRISFRTGLAVGKVASSIESQQNEERSWSTIMTTNEETAKQQLDQFNKSTSIPEPRKAYISAVSEMAVTISGPPSTTDLYFRSLQTTRGTTRVSLPVFGPYHAAHLYKEEKFNILDSDTEKNLRMFSPVAQVYSSATGKPVDAINASDMFQKAVEEILEKPLKWSNILEELVSEVSLTGGLECTLFSFGITNVTGSLVSALKAGCQSPVTIKDHRSWETPNLTNGRTQNDKIAIIGMSGRFPSAASPEMLWELLEKGLDVHREIPRDRFDAKAHTDPTGRGKNKTHTPYGCFIDEPGLFDPRFFNMSPREAAQTDPMGRLALVTAYEALEMSGYVPNRTPSTQLDRIATFYGQTSDDWREINAAENIDTYFITGGVRAFGPGRINYYFKFSGPSYSIDTACSSSLSAIQLACTSLWAGDCDMACAGGLNVLTNPDIFAGLSKGQFLSKTGGCKTYDNSADGYCRGDGCATIILKRYEDAIADKDNILGCILAAATNHSAEAVSITHPHAGAQEFLYKRVLTSAGVDPHEISYVEMHGTGTQAGDGVEMESVTNVFAPRNRQRRDDQPLFLGAVKANIGHGEAASGTNSLVKVLMMMQKNMIPANVGIKEKMNETFPKDLAKRRVIIPTNNTPFLRGNKPRKMFLNNFSAAGGNTAIVLEDGPAYEPITVRDPRTSQIITISSRSIASLKRNILELRDWLDDHPEADLPSISYTTTARRIQHNYRVAFSVSQRSDIQAALQNQLKDSYSPIPTAPTKAAFVFTGQGSQYASLGRKLYEELPSFKADIDELINLAKLQNFPSILPLIDGTDLKTVSPIVIQLGLACVQVALARLWQSWGVSPTAIVGHSLGEYAALHVAGVLSASDMIFLVGIRAKLLIERCTKFTHGMLAVKGNVSVVKNALGAKMPEIACINSPEETVLCGTVDIISTLHDFLASKGIKASKLNVPFAFHSMQVDPILESFRTAASSIHFGRPVIPVLCPLTGEVVTESGVFGPDYLVNHARQPVNFLAAMTNGYEQNVFNDKTAWIEIGAHPICLGLVRSSLKNIPVSAPSLRRNEDPWKTLTSSICTLHLAGVPINFQEYHRYFNDAHRLLVLPKMSFDEKKYWLDYHNNWCLTKGEAPMITTKLPIIEARQKLSTTSCHKIVKEELQPNSGTIVIQSNLAEPKLHAAVTGHLVNGSPLCPSSLYGDMAMTAADYLYKEIRPGASPVGMNVCAMEVHKPLVAEIPAPQDGQHLQLEASADLEEGVVRLIFRTVKPDGSLIRELGHGMVKYEEVDIWRQEWSRVQFMVQTQIDLLKQKLQRGEAHKLLKGIAYKLFRSLVTYSRPYQGMEEVIMNGELAEATAKVRFATKEEDGDFFCAPYWIDSLAHLSGFILNGSDVIDSSESVYISHGWNSIRLARKLSVDETYTTYVRMLPAPGNVSVGDVYIFHENEIVGVVTGLKFQNVPRRALNVMVPPPKSAKSSSVAAPRPPVNIPIAASLPLQAPVSTVISVSQQPTTHSTAPEAPMSTVVEVSSNAGSIVSKVMEIIAEETDLSPSELVDEAAFENLGVDSLMSLTISARFREDLNLDINSTLFTDYPTIGEMKNYFLRQGRRTSVVVADSSVIVESHIPLAPTSPVAQHHAPVANDTTWTSISSSLVSRPAPALSLATSVEDGYERVVLPSPNLQRSTYSLSSMSSTSSNPGYDSVFTPRSISTPHSEMADVPSPNSPLIPKSVPTIVDIPKSSWTALDSTLPQATSVLLQGSAKNATKMLFLLPDGSGSATSYVSIPNLAPDMKVYGLNCPFMKSPEKFTCGIDVVTQLYLAEIKRRQPKGPYTLGGWSAGGVIAYETARQMYLAGEKVEKLLLLDAPCPVRLPPLPTRLHVWFDKIGLLGTGKPGGTPAWLLPHFAATIKALSDYEPVRFPKGEAPRTVAVWCTDGVCKNPDDPRPPPGEEPAPMKWLLNNRTDFGDNGWGQLVDTDNMEYYVMSGNHFTMMKPPYADTLGKHMRLGLGYSNDS